MPEQSKDQPIQSNMSKIQAQLTRFPETAVSGDQGASLTTQMMLGVDIPEELKSFYWSFDKELHLGLLTEQIIGYLVASYNIISSYIGLYDTFTDDKAKDMIMKKINDINIEIKTITRGYRGLDGFTTRMSRTSIHQYDIDEGKEETKRDSAISKLSKSKVRL